MCLCARISLSTKTAAVCLLLFVAFMYFSWPLLLLLCACVDKKR